ncbi:MAG: TetR/AcrR family transcriptional regulator [Alphaproteobacteria bacterium]|nr:TetR/AcrR family transcriptional regulator [Alphaproteobacteria bacterium]
MSRTKAKDEGTPRGQARREQILKAASDLLLAEGYAAFSARGVAARAGTSLSHVQYYFATPADIVAELLDRFVTAYSAEVATHYHASGGAPVARLTRALEFLLNDEAYRRDCGVFMLEVAGFASRDRGIAAALARYYEVYLKAITAIVGDLNPALSAAQRRARARQAVSLIEGMAMTRPFLRDDDGAFSAREAARAIERLASAG